MNDSSFSAKNERKHNKKEKKHKRKKDKKHKKHKKSSRETPDSPTASKIPKDEASPSLKAASPKSNVDESQGIFGPALPPNFTKPHSVAVGERVTIGPAVPVDFLLKKSNSSPNEDNEDEEVIGPVPNIGGPSMYTKTQLELEERALQLKLASLNPETTDSEARSREEWMLELPDVGVKAGLASLKRTFHTKDRPDFSDRSSWTKTPNSSEAPTTSKSKDTTKSDAAKRHQLVHDTEQEKIAKKLKKEHKRDKSLYELHQKKLKEEKKKKESSDKPERRPFDREVDLQINKIDKNQTKSIVDKAKFLDSRFSSGSAKYL